MLVIPNGTWKFNETWILSVLLYLQLGNTIQYQWDDSSTGKETTFSFLVLKYFSRTNNAKIPFQNSFLFNVYDVNPMTCILCFIGSNVWSSQGLAQAWWSLGLQPMDLIRNYSTECNESNLVWASSGSNPRLPIPEISIVVLL